jgi:hypothetical protein
MTSRTPFPARRRLAAIDSTTGSTTGMRSIGLWAKSGIAIDKIETRSRLKQSFNHPPSMVFRAELEE